MKRTVITNTEAAENGKVKRIKEENKNK